VEGFEFDVGMKDSVSAPANAEVAALDRMRGAFERFNIAADKGAAANEHAGRSAHESEGFFKGFATSLVGQVAAAELAAEAIKKLGEAVLEAANFAVEVAEFRENAVMAYEAVTGTAEEGERTFAAIDRLATTIRIPAEQAHHLAQSLMVQGLENQEQLTSAISAIGALQRTGMEQGAEKLQRIIETSLATGHLEVNKRMLRGTGLNVDDLYSDLGKRLHMGRAQVAAELKAGKIDAEVGIASITEAINHGKIGEIAAKKFDIGDALTVFKNEMRAIFQDVDVGPLKQALYDFVSIFSQGSTTGKDFHDVVTGAINGVARAVSGAIESVLLFGLKLQLVGLQAYIDLFPVLDVFVRVVRFAYDADRAVFKFLGSLGGVGPAIAAAFGPLGLAADAAIRLGSALVHRAEGSAATGARPTEETGAPVVQREPAHAIGGMVHEPPPGEAFAAVSPGEMILPANFQLPALNFAAARDREPANANAGARVEFTWTGDVVVHGGGGDAEQVRQAVTTALTDQLEQLRLELGG
jgi:hypothetical protein